MADWWLVLVLVAIAALCAVYVLYRRQRGRGGAEDQQSAGLPPRDYTQEREDTRLTNMSDEDRAWQSASLEKDRATKDRDQAL